MLQLPDLPLELLHPRHRDRFDMLVTGRSSAGRCPHMRVAAIPTRLL
jgi:hypothetical protein